jgi:hypothetical protein
MATQTRRTTRRSATFFRATVKASMVTACCGLVLLSAVVAHAAPDWNGIPYQGLILNGTPLNGMPFNGLFVNGTPMQGMPMQGMPCNGVRINGTPLQGLPRNGLSLQAPTLPQEPLPAGSQEQLPWNGLSQRPLGTSTP